MPHLGIRDDVGQCRTQRLSAAARGSHGQQDTRQTCRAPTIQQRGQQRRVQPGDHREIGVGEGRLDGFADHIRLKKGVNDPGNCHRKSLWLPADTRSAERDRVSAAPRHRS